MIHQVKASKDDVERLKQVVKLQVALLEYAARHSSVDQKSLETHLQSAYKKEHAESITQWVNKHSTIHDPLAFFAAHSDAADKQKLLKRIKSDVELLYSPKAQRLEAAFQCNKKKKIVDPSWICAAADFCEQFYAIWGQSSNPGFPTYFFTGTAVPKESYTRWDFIKGFSDVNSGLYLCAMCDATAFRTKVDSRAFTSIEHFFPKSIYPHLSIHPYNLVPICSNCNSLKSDDNLMQLCSTNLGIQELLLPYQPQQPGINEIAYIEIGSRANQPGTSAAHPLEIKFKPSVLFQNRISQIEHFNAVYDIQKRWNNDLDQIDEQAFRRIQQFLMADVQMGNDLSDVQFLQERLEILMALTSKENLGKDPFGMATVWMLKYHVDTLRKEGIDAQLYKTLKSWAETHAKGWESLRKHIDELNQRVQ